MPFKFNPLTGTLDLVNTATGGTSSHNNLSGLQGGTTNQYYHLTQAQAQAVANLGTISTSNLTISESPPSGAGNEGDLWIQV